MTAEEIYNRLRSTRDSFLQRGRVAQRYTLPYWLPLDEASDETGVQSREVPYIGVGGEGTHIMASKLTLALMPVGELFFRFALDEVRLALEDSQSIGSDELSQEEVEKMQDRSAARKSLFDQVLAILERGALLDMEAENIRPVLVCMAIHLIIAGNCLMEDSKDNGLICHGLNKYVIHRHSNGDPRKAVMVEEKYIDSLDAKLLKLLKTEQKLNEEDGSHPDKKKIKIYTCIEWADKKCRWYQEALGVLIPWTKGKAPADAAPWMPLRYQVLSDSSYSPGYVEAVALSDLVTGDRLTQAITEGALGMARWLTGVRTGSGINLDTIKNSGNGAAVSANPDDIFGIHLGLPNQNFSVADNRLAKIEARLNAMFLKNEFRHSERTTAEEVRQVAIQADMALGGLHSVLTKDFLQPLVRRRLKKLLSQGRVPDLPEQIVRPVVNVGLAAIGRATDLERFRQFLGTLYETVGEKVVAERLSIDELMRRVGAACSVNTQGLIKSQASVDRERNQAFQQQLALQAASAVADPQRQANAAATMAAMPQASPDGAPMGPGP